LSRKTARDVREPFYWFINPPVTRSGLLLAILLCLSADRASAQETGLPPIPPDEPALDVKAFRFEGNTAFNDEQLLEAPVTIEQEQVRTRVRDYAGKSLTTEGLEAIRQAITRLYVGAGYINSGAVLPDQTVDDGVVLYRIVEGRLTDVNVTGNQRLRRGYIISRVQHAGKPPLNVIRLKDQLEVLRQNPNLTRINAELRPGTEPGEATLDVQVADSNPWQFGVRVSNRRSPASARSRSGCWRRIET
jgi:hemolysin activation/secretion protein